MDCSICSYCMNILTTLTCLFVVRMWIVYLRIHNNKRTIPRAKTPSVKTMVVLGSGGHTFEMFQLIKNISNKFSPRIYIIANSDTLSECKAKSFEESLDNLPENYVIERIPRSREVAQSYITSVLTTLKASIFSFLLICRHMPDCLICNGPGTCVPLCLSAFLLHSLGLKHIKTIYVESICRVSTLSLSGKILYHLTDYFIVQWPDIRKKYPHAKYFGRLI
ncbi:UDP-N-acetylglucosamine transferase subunit ALG14 [Parasteatoda tepidariorum]|uniref:UDP-N-acetylglucosamine transferase subunit ALG14 n=1 Tax=Parasteatoda tepidariorum TaxID=114398 RepID=UPI001C722571|nr:UDP-N-acetylglucosamine transferase subunit ALG14 homolog [Parasteatoda tepidariorum]